MPNNKVSKNVISRSGTTTELQRLDVLGTRAFRTLTFREGNFLAFMQVFETDTFHARRVEEKVFVVPRLDEPKALLRQRFDRAFSHLCISLVSCLN